MLNIPQQDFLIGCRRFVKIFGNNHAWTIDGIIARRMFRDGERYFSNGLEEMQVLEEPLKLVLKIPREGLVCRKIRSGAATSESTEN